MPQSLQLNIKPSFFDRNRQLTVDPDYVEFDNNDLISKPPDRFEKTEILAFRYGIKWISGYQFIIGRIYVIDIKSSNNSIIKLRLKSLYGVNKKRLAQKYLAIIQALYDNYFDDVSRSYLHKFDCNEQFKIEELNFFTQGISWNKNTTIIEWNDLDIREYQSYYSIFSKSNPSEYKTFEYLSDWNAGVIYSVIKGILARKGICSE